MNVTVFSKKPCPQCDATFRQLDKKKDAEGRTLIEYTVVDITTEPGAKEFITEQLGYLQAPVVLIHEGHWSDFRPSEENQGEHWSGFRPDALIELFKRFAPVA